MTQIKNHKHNHICPIEGCNYVGRQWATSGWANVDARHLDGNDLSATSLHCPTHRVSLIYAGNENIPPERKRKSFNLKWRKVHANLKP